MTRASEKSYDARRADVCRVPAYAGTRHSAVRALIDGIHEREEKRTRLDREIALTEERSQLGRLDVARALRELKPVLASWRETLYGDPVPAREVLRKLIMGPIVMEPLPALHGYRWRGRLNGGAVLEGTEKYLGCRGRESNPHEPKPAGF
jgi:hypothetical protein